MTGFAWAVAFVAAVSAIAFLARWLVRLGREIQLARARESFRLQRERLQELFLAAAAATGKPRGLCWVGCEFADEYLLVRDRATGRLVALVPATVAFEPIVGGEMEGVPAAREPRLATAVLHFRRGAWRCDGRTLFNMLPPAALVRFAQQYESVPPPA